MQERLPRDAEGMAKSERKEEIRERLAVLREQRVGMDMNMRHVEKLRR